MEEHAHPQALGEHGQLGADVAVADHAQRLAPDLARAVDALGPLAAVRGGVLLRDAAEQQDGFRQHQLGHGPRVGERRVEHGDAALGRRVQVNLVRPDAERADGHELLSHGEHLSGELRARADAEEMNVGEQARQVGLRDRAGSALDVRVPGALEHLDGVVVDALEEQDADAVFVERDRHEWGVGRGT